MRFAQKISEMPFVNDGDEAVKSHLKIELATILFMLAFTLIASSVFAAMTGTSGRQYQPYQSMYGNYGMQGNNGLAELARGYAEMKAKGVPLTSDQEEVVRRAASQALGYSRSSGVGVGAGINDLEIFLLSMSQIALPLLEMDAEKKKQQKQQEQQDAANADAALQQMISQMNKNQDNDSIIKNAQSFLDRQEKVNDAIRQEQKSLNDRLAGETQTLAKRLTDGQTWVTTPPLGSNGVSSGTTVTSGNVICTIVTAAGVPMPYAGPAFSGINSVVSAAVAGTDGVSPTTNATPVGGVLWDVEKIAQASAAQKDQKPKEPGNDGDDKEGTKSFKRFL